jgi:hypothetical protein
MLAVTLVEVRRPIMKTFAKVAFGAAMLAGAVTMAAAPAAAAVSVGVGFGPGYYGPPAPAYSCDPYSRFYDPYYCGYYGPGYYGPGYWGPGGVWIGGHFGGGFHGGGFRGGFHGGGRR